ncbi:MAG: lipoyl(octanoyl) transferase LipB [Gammaproteobacteria bacterium]|nr:lipoyl(octanoyl) transferase LipB [Gammaproteobacteria bacterium]
MTEKLIVREMGRREYVPVWREMQAFTTTRSHATIDELWFVEHPPVYTLGVGGKEQHLLDPHNIPVIRSNRGGQVTYHGPGQIIAYTLFDMHRKKMGIRALISFLENAVIELLGQFKIQACARKEAPGVYIGDSKIAALGLRVSRGYSYHGLALNVGMDLTPFEWINPCGYQGLKITQLRNLGIEESIVNIKKRLKNIIISRGGYTLHEVV